MTTDGVVAAFAREKWRQRAHDARRRPAGKLCRPVQPLDYVRSHLKQTPRHNHLDGIDMEIAEHITLSDAQKLVAPLNRDFSKQFIMTMLPDLRG